MMLRSVKILLIAFALFTLHACKDNKANEIPISDFFKSAGKSNFKISPDGKYLSYVKPNKEKQSLFIESLTDGKEQLVSSLNDYSIRDYSWTFDNQIIFFSQDPFVDKHSMFVFDVATSKLKNLLTENKVRMRLLSRSRISPDMVTITMNKRDSANFDVYNINIKTGEVRPYLVNPGNIKEWFPDVDGKIRLAKKSDGVDESILYRPNDNAQFKEIIKNNFKNSVKPVAFTGVKNYFYALSNVNRDKSALVEINAENGKEEKVVFLSDKADIQRIEYSKNKHRIDFASWEEAKPQKHFLNKDAEHIYNNLSKQLTDNEITIMDRDTAENKFIVSTYTDRNPGSIYLYERKTERLTKLEDNSAINPAQLCEMQPISYTASDGLLITGYLTMPQGNAKTNLPVVVIPHDGPFGPTRDSWRYNAEVQFLANRGYAVLQINYRGSAGFGKKFFNAGFKEIGGKIQQDITDGVTWLIDKKIANPHKIAIFGRGFGGFSALYGVSFHPKLYSCAITQFGIINILSYIKDVNPFFKPSLQMMYEMVGNPETEAGHLRDISPVFHPDKIKVPLLIFQGGKDPRANISELNHFVAELQRNKVPVTYNLKKNERQAFRGEAVRMEMYAEIEKFLDANLRGKN